MFYKPRGKKIFSAVQKYKAFLSAGSLLHPPPGCSSLAFPAEATEPGTASEVLVKVADIKNPQETRTRGSGIKLALRLAWVSKASGQPEEVF